MVLTWRQWIAAAQEELDKAPANERAALVYVREAVKHLHRAEMLLGSRLESGDASPVEVTNANQ